MTIPLCIIEVWDGANLLYTIKDAISTHVKNVVTTNIGTFDFVVPTKKNGSYNYGDIELFKTVKIWMGYDSINLTTDPLITGPICRIAGLLTKEDGYQRVFEGKGQGEITERIFKKDKLWQSAVSHEVVEELADDLSLGLGGIDDTEMAEVDLLTTTETYFELFKRLSDYWKNAETLKKDWYVNNTKIMQWKNRPLRGSGVETLTVGENISSYNVLRDISSVKNAITVYGAAETFKPRNQDDWTEAPLLPNWTATAGSLSLETVGKKLGTYCIDCYTGSGAYTTTFKRTLPPITIRHLNELCFWRLLSATAGTTRKVRLLAPSTSKYFEADLGSAVGWQFKTYGLGYGSEYDENRNPNGLWTKTVSPPNWWDIQGIQFHVEYDGNDQHTQVDALYFQPDRWVGEASDLVGAGSSGVLYGQRDMEYIDDKLTSDTQCESRAKTLLYQLKDPPIRLDIKTMGNGNIKPGDRLTISIPAENITPGSAGLFDVTQVEHFFNNGGWETFAAMVNTGDVRTLPIATVNEFLLSKFDMQRDLGRGAQIIR